MGFIVKNGKVPDHPISQWWCSFRGNGLYVEIGSCSFGWNVVTSSQDQVNIYEKEKEGLIEGLIRTPFWKKDDEDCSHQMFLIGSQNCQTVAGRLDYPSFVLFCYVIFGLRRKSKLNQNDCITFLLSVLGAILLSTCEWSLRLVAEAESSFDLYAARISSLKFNKSAPANVFTKMMYAYLT